MSGPHESRRDVTLTTLIDLLVQVIFVFTLILIGSEALEGGAEERGYIAPEAWKTLISIFDVDAKKTVKEQIAQIREKYEAAIKSRDEMRKKVDELDARIAELEKKAGAPGFPPCRDDDGREQYVLTGRIDISGKIIVLIAPGAQERVFSTLEPTNDTQPLMRDQFTRKFSEWHKHGLSRKPQCKYVAAVEYDPRAAAGDYQPAISAISSMFRINRITVISGR